MGPHTRTRAGDRQEARRHASVLVLKELAVNAPTLFYSYVQQFFDSIWGALRDPKVRFVGAKGPEDARTAEPRRTQCTDARTL